MWIFWALISAVLVAVRRPFEKKIISEMHHFTYGFLTQCISLPIIGIALLMSGDMLNPFRLDARFWIPLFITSVGYYPLSTFLYKHALKHGELSKVLPLQSLWPVFSLFLAWFTLDEVPTLFASIGVVATVIGIYALGLKGRRLHRPLQPFREDSASRAMLLTVVLVTLVSVLEKLLCKFRTPYSIVSRTPSAQLSRSL